jgi:ComF family protein
LEKVKLLKPVCPYCEKVSIDGFTHAKCNKVYGLDGLTSVWDYDGVIKKAIQALKFKYSTEVGHELSANLVNVIKTQYTKYYIPNTGSLVPIPLYWHRENVRGFNQSIEVGKSVAGKMGWGFAPRLLIKKKPTTSQVELSVSERKQNLRGVFSISPGILISQYPDIILFDDVFTTGSTLKEAAKVLKRSGVKRVWGLTLAR